MFTKWNETPRAGNVRMVSALFLISPYVPNKFSQSLIRNSFLHFNTFTRRLRTILDIHLIIFISVCRKMNARIQIYSIYMMCRTGIWLFCKLGISLKSDSMQLHWHGYF